MKIRDGGSDKGTKILRTENDVEVTALMQTINDELSRKSFLPSFQMEMSSLISETKDNQSFSVPSTLEQVKVANCVSASSNRTNDCLPLKQKRDTKPDFGGSIDSSSDLLGSPGNSSVSLRPQEMGPAQATTSPVSGSEGDLQLVLEATKSELHIVKQNYDCLKKQLEEERQDQRTTRALIATLSKEFQQMKTASRALASAVGNKSSEQEGLASVSPPTNTDSSLSNEVESETSEGEISESRNVTVNQDEYEEQVKQMARLRQEKQDLIRMVVESKRERKGAESALHALRLEYNEVVNARTDLQLKCSRLESENEQLKNDLEIFMETREMELVSTSSSTDNEESDTDVNESDEEDGNDDDDEETDEDEETDDDDEADDDGEEENDSDGIDGSDEDNDSDDDATSTTSTTVTASLTGSLVDESEADIWMDDDEDEDEMKKPAGTSWQQTPQT